MKKLILLIVMATILNSAIAQTKSQIISFLSDRTMPFNKNVKAIQVNNLDSVIKSCKKKNISYSHDFFILNDLTFIDPNAASSGYSETIIKNKRVPFVMYKTYRNEFNNLVIEVVSGTDSW